MITFARANATTTEEPDGGTGRPGLRRGLRVIGVHTAEAFKINHRKAITKKYLIAMLAFRIFRLLHGSGCLP